MITKAVGEKYKGIIGLVQKVFTEDNKNKTLLEIIVNDKDSITTVQPNMHTMTKIPVNINFQTKKAQNL